MAQGAAHEPTPTLRATVRSHIAVGVTQASVARLLGIGVDTLVKHYREEIDTAVDQANATVAGRLFRAATGKQMETDEDGKPTGSAFPAPQQTTAMIFWLKTRAGWRETERHEVVGPDNGPVRTVDEPFIDASKLSTDELEQLQALVKKGAHDRPRDGDQR